MPSLYQRRVLSDASWDESRATVNRWLDGLLGNGPGYLRMTSDDGKRLHQHSGAALSSGNWQTMLRSDVGNHVAVLKSSAAPSAAASPANSALLIQDAMATFGGDLAAGSATLSGTLTVAGDTSLGGNLAFSGTAKRIRGDLTNATHSNRLLFQTTTASGASSLGVIPAAGGTTGALNAYSTGSPDAASIGQLLAIDASAVVLNSTRTGAAGYLPLLLWTAGIERLRIDTAGAAGTTTVTGALLATTTLALGAGTPNAVTLTHAATAPRIITIPDASGTMALSTPPPAPASGTSYLLTTAWAAAGAGIALTPGTWLVLGAVSWLPSGAGDVSAIGQIRLAVTAGAGTLSQHGANYTFTAVSARASGVAMGTLVVPAAATVSLQAQKIGGTGDSRLESWVTYAVRVV